MTPSTPPNATSAPSELDAVTTPMKPKAKAKTKTAHTSKVAEGRSPGKGLASSNSKVYHCAGTKYYGRTKQWSYMTEVEAKTAGNQRTTARRAADKAM